MYVVGHAADGEGQHVVVLANARHVRPEPHLRFFGNEPFAVLGAKDQMDVVLCVAVGQRCRPSGPLENLYHLLPRAYAPAPAYSAPSRPRPSRPYAFSRRRLRSLSKVQEGAWRARTSVNHLLQQIGQPPIA